jgi:hypothetical protein
MLGTQNINRDNMCGGMMQCFVFTCDILQKVWVIFFRFFFFFFFFFVFFGFFQGVNSTLEDFLLLWSMLELLPT